MLPELTKLLIISATDGIFYRAFFCLTIYQQDNLKSFGQILGKNFWKGSACD